MIHWNISLSRKINNHHHHQPHVSEKKRNFLLTENQTPTKTKRIIMKKVNTKKKFMIISKLKISTKKWSNVASSWRSGLQSVWSGFQGIWASSMFPESENQAPPTEPTRNKSPSARSVSDVVTDREPIRTRTSVRTRTRSGVSTLKRDQRRFHKLDKKLRSIVAGNVAKSAFLKLQRQNLVCTRQICVNVLCLGLLKIQITGIDLKTKAEVCASSLPRWI